MIAVTSSSATSASPVRSLPRALLSVLSCVLSGVFLCGPVLLSCRSTASLGTEDSVQIGDLVPTPKGQELIACGQAFHVGAPVVLWTDPEGYDATRDQLHFEAPEGANRVAAGELRFHPGRRVDGRAGEYLVPPGSNDLTALKEAVDLFVIHYDACGISKQCFKVLHDLRGLSVHFMIDVDGTIYQTLDLRERAWHAGKANTRSIGVEVANFGARSTADEPGIRALDELHEGRIVHFPSWMEPLQIRTPGFEARPARWPRITGPTQGAEYTQYDFTAEQYASLARLNAALCRVFPRIRPEAPRDGSGAVETRVLDESRYEQFHGVVGHHHVSAAKQDPGPAFDWEKHLVATRALLRMD